MKKFITILLINFLFVAKVSFAGSEIQWKHYLNDTTIKHQNPNWFIQTAVLDNEITFIYHIQQMAETLKAYNYQKVFSMRHIQWQKSVLSSERPMVLDLDQIGKGLYLWI
ncbi:MAG: hypothetical protein IPN14_01125 [Bacteroidetes bacterium]|nr:hypothetical protein [Bacteroidota bacterium]